MSVHTVALPIETLNTLLESTFNKLAKIMFKYWLVILCVCITECSINLSVEITFYDLTNPRIQTSAIQYNSFINMLNIVMNYGAVISQCCFRCLSVCCLSHSTTGNRNQNVWGENAWCKIHNQFKTALGDWAWMWFGSKWIWPHAWHHDTQQMSESHTQRPKLTRLAKKHMKCDVTITSDGSLYTLWLLQNAAITLWRADVDKFA